MYVNIQCSIHKIKRRIPMEMGELHCEMGISSRRPVKSHSD